VIITIDGPVACGKSSVAKELAKELKIYYLYTGLLYRAVAYILLKNNPLGDSWEKIIQSLDAEKVKFIKDITYDYGSDNGDMRPYIFYKGEEITKELYLSSIDQGASFVSSNKYVRAALLDLQREVATRYDIIADGRDCGSIVFPNADYKFYLTARVEVRALRVMLDEKRGAAEQDLEKIKAEIEDRDQRDSKREIAPLVIPENAMIVDNSDLTFAETVGKFLSIIKKS
jgi:CMP/dCMP kinase